MKPSESDHNGDYAPDHLVKGTKVDNEGQFPPEEKEDKSLMDMLLNNEDEVFKPFDEDEISFTDLLEFERINDYCQKQHNETCELMRSSTQEVKPFGGSPISHTTSQSVFEDGAYTKEMHSNDAFSFKTNAESMNGQDASKKMRTPASPSQTLKYKFRESSRPVPMSYMRSQSFGGHVNHGHNANGHYDNDFSPAHSSIQSVQSTVNQNHGQPKLMVRTTPNRSLSCPVEDGMYYPRGDGYCDQYSMQDNRHVTQNSPQFMGYSANSNDSSFQNSFNSFEFDDKHKSMMGHPKQMYHSPQRSANSGVYRRTLSNGNFNTCDVLEDTQHNGSGRGHQYSMHDQNSHMNSIQANNEVIHTGYVIEGGVTRALSNHSKENSSIRKVATNTKPLSVKKSISKGSEDSSGSPMKKSPKGKRSSQYRGVTRHRRSGRWEAHIWVRETGKQVYLGGYELEEHAAEAYDVAALKCKGKKVKTNFEISRYAELVQYMDTISLEELVMAVRRQSQGFARGSSKYRGVTRHPNGRWEARIGMPGSRHIYLGLYNDEAEAARAYDRALVKLRGSSAATNFSLSNYTNELKEYHTQKQKEILGKQKLKSVEKANVKAYDEGGPFDNAVVEGQTPACNADIIAGHATRCI